MNAKNQFTDRFLLLVTGLACALLASLFWRYSQEKGFIVLSLLLNVVLLAQNRRLRIENAKLRETPGGGP